MRSGKSTKVPKVKSVNILVTGDDNYNNITKFNETMQHIYDQIQDVKRINTFGSVYGAELLARLYAQQNFTEYYEYTSDFLKTKKYSTAQSYYIIMDIAIKRMDLVIIFSSVRTKKIDLIIKKCKSDGIECLIVKE